jgi:hypothetical protein
LDEWTYLHQQEACAGARAEAAFAKTSTKALSAALDAALGVFCLSWNWSVLCNSDGEHSNSN